MDLEEGDEDSIENTNNLLRMVQKYKNMLSESNKRIEALKNEVNELRKGQTKETKDKYSSSDDDVMDLSFQLKSSKKPHKQGRGKHQTNKKDREII